MLRPTLPLNKMDAAGIIPHLYEIFRRDFINSAAMLNGTIWVDPQVARKSEGMEETFWHLTTRENYEYQVVQGRQVKTCIGRYTDFDRAARLEWVRPIIDNPNDPCVSIFYHKETTGKKPIRLYLWAHAHNFVVILQKLGKSTTYLVTSFYVDNQGKEAEYRNRLAMYKNGSDANLSGCAWF